jgi:hypothetical protein
VAVPQRLHVKFATRINREGILRNREIYDADQGAGAAFGYLRKLASNYKVLREASGKIFKRKLSVPTGLGF